MTLTAAELCAELVRSGAPANVEQVLREHALRRPTPCFVYFMDLARSRVSALREAFEGLFDVSFAMKCNQHPEILRRMQGWVQALDVSSSGELEAAIALGWPADAISFTGPAKQERDLRAALALGVGEVVLESLREAELLAALARGTAQRPRVLVRVAPSRVPKGFGVNMAGRPCQFGIDEEDLPVALPAIRALPELNLVGFHIYSGTQCLKHEAIAENYRIFADIFRRASDIAQIQPSKLIFGSGIGIPYHDTDVAVDLAALARAVVPSLRSLLAEPRFAQAQLVLETGRYLLGEAGIYLTRVVNRKSSRGSQLATFDGGMHHHLGACGHLGMVVHRNYRLFKVSSQVPDGPLAPYDLYGPLCTSIDVLGRGVLLPGLEVGDVVGILASGAYAVTASPVHFISHPLPGEWIAETVETALAVVEIGPAQAPLRGNTEPRHHSAGPCLPSPEHSARSH